MSRRGTWTPAEIAALREGRAARPMVPFETIAAAIGRSREACQWKFAELSRETGRPSRAGQDSRPKAAPAPATRRCLTCRRGFEPDHRANFVCEGCKKNEAWRCAS